ncbi:glycosyltransferase [Muribaculaceae bacterium Isolate-004 (NCI)]|nr:glycosyltransferase [Muribaculaceae bacterium Isolate-004 (NCI)]
MVSGIGNVIFNFLSTLHQQGSIKNICRFIFFRLRKSKVITVRRRGNKKWAYIAYIPEALVREDIAYLNGHQNRREMKMIAECFLDNGYNIVVHDYQDKSSAPDHTYDVVFGLEPNFTICARQHPLATKVYYGTGAYSKYANAAVIGRTDEFNRKHGVAIQPRRLAPDDDCAEICDKILQIGSRNTIETYPEHLRQKIMLIDQSSNFLRSDLSRLDVPMRNKFIWLGSSGSILKGVDLVIEAFMSHPELEIDLVGPIEEDVKAVYEHRLAKSPNIRFHGFVDINSDKFLQIIRGTSFLIYPSVTEGGAPGAVIACMKLGIVPIVSKVASSDNCDNLGFVFENVSLESVEAALTWCKRLQNGEIYRLGSENIKESTKYTIENFRTQFNNYVRQWNG